MRYQGKLFSILGDSISTLEGYNPPEYGVFYEGENKLRSGVFAPEDTWWGRVIEVLGARLLINNSYSGTTVLKHPLSETESHASSDERTSALSLSDKSPDVIMIYMGLNDYGYGMRVGSVDGAETADTFSSAYLSMLIKIKRRYPHADIWCFTLPVGDKGDAAIHGHNISEYSAVIRRCAEREACRLIDLATMANGYASLDGYHPTREGMMTIADAVIAECSGG